MEVIKVGYTRTEIVKAVAIGVAIGTVPYVADRIGDRIQERPEPTNVQPAGNRTPTVLNF